LDRGFGQAVASVSASGCKPQAEGAPC
jgi:hypothetical protein